MLQLDSEQSECVRIGAQAEQLRLALTKRLQADETAAVEQRLADEDEELRQMERKLQQKKALLMQRREEEQRDSSHPLAGELTQQLARLQALEEKFRSQQVARAKTAISM